MGISADDLFRIFNYGVLPFWLLLVFLPRARITTTLVHSGLMPCVLGVAYTVLLVGSIASATPDAPALDFGSIEGIRAGFQSDTALLAGWIHYLAFDLFVGAWCCRDAARTGVPHVVVVPVLILVLMAGPAGLLLYLVVRGVWKRRLTLREAD